MLVVMTFTRRLVPGLLLLAVAAALLAATSQAPPRTHTARSTSRESGVLADINVFRSAHDLPRLRLSSALGAAAREHSQQMAADGYFAHTSADGSAFWKRIQGFYRSTSWH